MNVHLILLAIAEGITALRIVAAWLTPRYWYEEDKVADTNICIIHPQFILVQMSNVCDQQSPYAT